MAGPFCAAQTAHPNSLVGLNLGTVNVGSASAAGTVMFTFDSGGTLDSAQPFQVVTQGAPNLDFVSATGSTCNSTTTYSASQTCQVTVSFHPKYPGPRYGAVLLYGSTGTVIATAYVYGSGAGPLVTFSPGASSVVPGGPGIYVGLAVDASGDVFILNNESTIEKNAPSGGGYVQTTIQLTDNPNPNATASGITVDGAGNIFANFGGYGIEASPSGTGYTQSLVFGGLTHPDQITVDGSGNLYITERDPDKVIKAVRSATGYTHSPINTSIIGPGAIAVDGSGNIYVTGNGNVYKLTPSGGGSYAQETIVQASPEEGYGSGLAVDAAGDVYVSGSDGSPGGPNGAVFKATPSAGSFVLSTVLSDLDNPTLVELGENGNLYATSSFDGRATQVAKIALALPPSLTFAATADGSISSDSPQTVTVTNVGNAALAFPVPASGDNPTISANFTLESSGEGDCPLTSSGSSSAGMLAPGASCLLPISFEPEAPASRDLSGTLLLTDNKLNAAPPGYAVQSIALAGAVPGPPFGNLATPVDSVTGANPVSHSHSVRIMGWVADPVDQAPISNVTVYIDGTSVGKPTLGLARPAVASEYGNADLDSGYQMLYPAASLAVGVHHVQVTAIDSSGYSKTFGPLSFTVQ